MNLKAKAAGLAVAALLASGLATGLAQPASAFTAEPASWGAANLISYANSDLESGVGDWVNYSNSTVTQDTSQAFLHNDSLKMVSVASGSQAVKMGTGTGAPQVSVTGGDVYRESAWVRLPSALSSRTVTFADGFYDSTGTWIGWTSGATVTLAAKTGWQYVEGKITAPANAASMVGSPRITEAGVAAAEALNVDEILVVPYRAADVIGAEDTSGDCGAFSSANTAIGPLQSCKVFYSASSALPSSFTGSVCDNLPTNVTCVISYKVQTTNVASFVGSIPAGKNVILEYWQEPENDTFANGGSCNTGTNGGNFVCQFEAQSNLIRSSTTAANRANVFVADNGMTYQYAAGTSHNLGGAPSTCSFIVPSSYVDFYFGDHYEFTASGNNMSVDSGSKAEWSGWLGCVSPQNKPIGVAEYGLNCGQSGGVGSAPNALTTSEGMSADNSYLAGNPSGLPVVLWEYWWDANAGCQFTTGGSPDGTQAVQQWQANETQNGGGAN